MKKIIIAIIFLINIVAAIAQSGPSLYPGTLELDIKRGNSQGRFTVFNLNQDEKKYKISIREKDNQGNDSLLAESLRVFPKYLTLGPGESQEVRVIVKNFNYETFNDGEYRGSLMIEELESNLEKKYSSKDAEKDQGAQLRFLVNVGMAVYGYVGELNPQIEADLSVEEGWVKGNIMNKGNYSYPVKYEILGASGIIEEKNIIKLIRDDEAKLNIKIPEEAKSIKIVESKMGIELYEMKL